MLRQPAPAHFVPHPQYQWESGSLREVAKPIENYILWSTESFYPEELIDLRGSLPPYLARTAEVPPGATAEIVQVFTWGAQTRALSTDQTGRNLSLLVHSPIKYKYLVKKKAMSKPMLLPEILKKVPTLPLVVYPCDDDWTNSAQCKSIESLAIRHIVDERFLVCGKLVRGDQGLIRCLFTIPESLRVRLVTAEGLVQNPHYSSVDWEALLAQLTHVGQSLRLSASLLETALIREVLPVARPTEQGISQSDVIEDIAPAPDVIAINSLRPSGPLPPPPPPSIPPDADLPDESFHYYTLNGIVKDALRAALRAAHAEGKLSPDIKQDMSSFGTNGNPRSAKVSATVGRSHPQYTANQSVAPTASAIPMSTSSASHSATTSTWSQGNPDSKRNSLSSEGSGQNSITRPQRNNYSPQQLQIPTVAPQRSRSPFRRPAATRNTFIPTVNLGQRSVNSGHRSHNSGQRRAQASNVGQQSLESSQRSLDSGYRSLESRGRSPPRDRRSPMPEISRTNIPVSMVQTYHRQLSNPMPTPSSTYNRSTLPHSSSWSEHNNGMGGFSSYNGNYNPSAEIDHYSASIENMSLDTKQGTNGVTVHVKPDSHDRYRYTDSLPVTDDGYLSPQEVRQEVLPSSDYHTNPDGHSNSLSYSSPNSGMASTSHSNGQGRQVSTLDQVPADLSHLTVEEVGQILRLLNLESHKESFLHNMIDGAMLMDLAADDLRDLGLSCVECTRLNKFVREGWRPKMQ